MKVIDFSIDRDSKIASVKYQLTEDEFKDFDIREYLHITPEPILHDREKVIRATFRAMDYPIEMMSYAFSRDRSGKFRKVVDVRQACMYQLRKHTDMSLTAIGKLFEFTHASVIHNINQFMNRLDTGDEVAQLLNREVEYILDEEMLKKS